MVLAIKNDGHRGRIEPMAIDAYTAPLLLGGSDMIRITWRITEEKLPKKPLRISVTTLACWADAMGIPG